MHKSIFTKYLPAGLLCFFFVVAFIITFQQAHTYGLMTVDEQIQEKYGQLSLAWYKTGGKDQSFMIFFNPNAFMPEHGPVIETIIAEAQIKFGHLLYTRALIVGLIGLAGVLATALCGFELGGWWGALLAALGLWLYPRFIGTIFNNSKDIPFTTCMAFMLWAVLLLTRQWGRKWNYLIHSSLIGLLLGFSISIRVNALLWLPMLGCLPVGWWLGYGLSTFKERKVIKSLLKQIHAACIILLSAFIAMYICWPFFALDPLNNLYKSIVVNTKYPWDGVVAFNGHLYPATQVPRSYIPTWLIIGSPPAVIFLAIIGTIIICWQLIKRRNLNLQVAMIVLSILFPLITLLALHPVLYNALRQFLFLIPSLILIAVYGFMQMFNYLKQRKQKFAMIALVLIVVSSQLLVIKDMADLYPYEYIYFSPLVGGFTGNVGKYEIDYEALCMKPALDWLTLNYKQYTSKAQPSLTTSIGSGIVTLYSQTVFKDGSRSPKPDFYINFAPSKPETGFPSYKPIHTVSLKGDPLCIVKTR